MANEFKKVKDRNNVIHPVYDEAVHELLPSSATSSNKLSTASDITNIYKVMGEVGAKNLNGTKYANTTSNGVVFTPNADGTVGVERTSSSSSDAFAQYTSFKAPFSAQVKLTGGASGSAYAYGYDDTANSRPYTDSTKTTVQTPSDGNVNDTNESSFWMEEGHLYHVVLRVASSFTGTGLYKPMIRLTSDTDTTYVPYVPTNAELQANKASNSDIQDVYEVMGENGAKNRLPLTLANLKALNTVGTWSGNSYAVNGVTFAVQTDSKGNITGINTTGTSSAATFFVFATDLSFLSVGTQYTMSGCPSGGANNKYGIAYYAEGVTGGLQWDYGEGVTFTAVDASQAPTKAIRIVIRANQDVSGKSWYPMLRLAQDTDPTYQPPCMTNLELTEQKVQIYPNAASHRNIYRGKSLGTSVTAEQFAQISAGTFNDMYIGDYWTIGGVNWVIADFDYWLKTGDTECTTHHVVIVPETCLYNAKMNTENVTIGAYVGSAMYTANLDTAKTTINTAFGSSHILSHKERLSNAVIDNRESAGAWYASSVELMNEIMVFGSNIFHNCANGTGWPDGNYTIDKTQLALFKLNPVQIVAYLGNSRSHWWLRDVAFSTDFAYVGSNGNSAGTGASNSFGVRPVFGITG